MGRTDNTAYPRPQLVREQWQSLNGPWKFTFNDCRNFIHPTEPIPWQHQILVPFPPESQASGLGNTGFHPVCWYEREFDLAPGDARVLLHFGAVDYSARSEQELDTLSCA